MSNPFRRSMASIAVAGLAGAGAFVVASPAQSVPADTACPAPFPVADLAKGQLVDGLTVSSGNEPDVFTGEVLGVLEDGIAPGLDMILVRLSNVEIDRVGGIWAGMSGSPVYAEDGRIIGAVAYGLAGTSPVAGVTPAADMQAITAIGPEAELDAAARVAIPARMQARLVESGMATEREVAGGFEQLPTPVAVSGMRNLARLNKLAGRLGLDNVHYYRAGSAPSAQAEESEIFAGSNLAASISYGDLSMLGVGTTTMVCDGKPIGFGHPFGWFGETSLTLHSSDAIYIQEDPTWAPFKVANAGGPVGVIDQDRLAGIKGLLGEVPETVQVVTTVHSGGRSREGTTYVSVPMFAPDGAAFGLLSNQDRVFDRIGGGSALVHFTISGTTAEGEPFTVVRTNRYANTFDISFDTIWEVGNAVWSLNENDLVGIDIDNVDVTSTMSSKARMFRVGQIQIKSGGVWKTLTSDSVIKRHPGRLINYRAVLNSRRGEFGSKIVIGSVRVPEAAEPGSFGQLSLGQFFGGDCEECYFEDVEGPASLQEIIDGIEDAPRNDEFVANLELFSESEEGAGMVTAQAKKLIGDVITNSKFFSVRIRR
ncbi:MAG TPA: hypothetical protein VLI04_12765 [Nocardioidaceae bacterium]|nr:hypothetical protein [Nocardioidaceae bacterium]